ncbi:MAG: nucleoside hydrolase [Verrucomicrobia bacterium]|nr:nucleoside hydrolase [Verrucomicrobiota bacterium]
MTRFRWVPLWVLLGLVSRPDALCGQDAPESPAPPQTRARIIIDNDFGGDPDGLFQLAHHLLSHSVEVRGIVGSHHYPDGLYGNPGTPENACAAATELLTAMRLAGKIPVFQGAAVRMEKDFAPVPSAAADFIVREAMREGAATPLLIACGGGLTDLASACRMEPKIAKSIRLVWIGGPEHQGIAFPPPGAQAVEYNLGIDPRAAQFVFNRSGIPIWQVPRDAYRQALVSCAELDNRMGNGGNLARFLNRKLRDFTARAFKPEPETHVLGDSPLVLLTALRTPWEPDTSSSRHITVPTPNITDEGTYETNPQGRPMRVYTQLDTRLMFEDFYAKVVRFDQRANSNKR